MYQAFLEPWQEGTLTDQGSQARAAGHKIDCSRAIFICMTNLGQVVCERESEWAVG